MRYVSNLSLVIGSLVFHAITFNVDVSRKNHHHGFGIVCTAKTTVTDKQHKNTRKALLHKHTNA